MTPFSAAFAAWVATVPLGAVAVIITNGLSGTGVPLTWAMAHAGVVWSDFATWSATSELWTTRANVPASSWAACRDPAREAAFEAIHADGGEAGGGGVDGRAFEGIHAAAGSSQHRTDKDQVPVALDRAKRGRALENGFGHGEFLRS